MGCIPARNRLANVNLTARQSQYCLPFRRLRQGKRLPPELTRIAALADREGEESISGRGGREGMSSPEQLMVAN